MEPSTTMNHLDPKAEVPTAGVTATSLPSTASGRKPWEVPKDTQRFIPVPEKPYPSLAEGQRLLGMSDAEFRKLYADSQSRIRAFNKTEPPSKAKRVRYGQRVENHESVVVPLEAAFPVLKCCSGNWGAKWILRRAKQVIGAKVTSARSKNQAMVQQVEEASQQMEVADLGAQEPRLQLGLEFEDSLPALGAASQVTAGFPDAHQGYYGSLGWEPEWPVDFVPLTEESMIAHGAGQECLEPDFDGHFLVERDACTALFNNSKAWLAAGPPIRYN